MARSIGRGGGNWAACVPTCAHAHAHVHVHAHAQVPQVRRADAPTPRSTTTTTTTTKTPRAAHAAEDSKGEPTQDAVGPLHPHKGPLPSLNGSASIGPKRPSSGVRVVTAGGADVSSYKAKVPQARGTVTTTTIQAREARRRLAAGRSMLARELNDDTIISNTSGSASRGDHKVAASSPSGSPSASKTARPVGGGRAGGGGGGGGNIRGGNVSSGYIPYKVPKLRLEIDPQHFDLLDEMQLRDAWRIAALRLPSTTTTTTAAAAAAAAALLPLGTSGVQLRPLPASRSSGNFTPYLFVDFPLGAMAHGTHPQPPTVLCLDAVTATALFR